MKHFGWILLVLLLGPGSQAKADAPLQLALWESIQLVDASESITGLRLNIYGVNQDLTGLDYGLLHELRGSGLGAQLGLVSLTLHDFTGIQASIIYTSVGGDMTGLQHSFVNQAGSLTGIQVGIVNLTEPVQGLQIGFYNQCDGLQGLQLGLINHDRSNSKWPILPLLRFGS